LFPGDVPDQNRPNASTVNPSTAIAFNTWATGIPTSGGSAGQLAIYSTNALDVIVDVVGYFAPSNAASPFDAAGQLTLVTPMRVADTRSAPLGPIGYDAGGRAIAAGAFAANQTRRFAIGGQRFAGVGVPADARGILANVTIVQDGPSGGFVTAFPGD